MIISVSDKNILTKVIKQNDKQLCKQWKSQSITISNAYHKLIYMDNNKELHNKSWIIDSTEQRLMIFV